MPAQMEQVRAGARSVSMFQQQQVQRVASDLGLRRACATYPRRQGGAGHDVIRIDFGNENVGSAAQVCP